MRGKGGASGCVLKLPSDDAPSVEAVEEELAEGRQAAVDGQRSPVAVHRLNTVYAATTPLLGGPDPRGGAGASIPETATRRSRVNQCVES